MHAAGHASLAAAAGVLARALAGHSPIDSGSTALGRAGAFAATGTQGVLLLAICGVFAALAKLVGGALSAWAEARLAADVGAAVRSAVLDGVLAVGSTRPPRHGDHGSAERDTADAVHADRRGERLAALTSDVHAVEHGVAHGVLAEIRAVVQLVPLGALLIILAPRLAGSAVVALGAFGVLAFALRRAFKRAHTRAAVSAAALVEAADEAVRHAELWATYGAKRRIRAHLSGIGRALAQKTARMRVRASLLASTSEVLGAVALVLVLLLAARGALGVEHGVVVPFAIAFFMAYRPLRDLVDARIARTRAERTLRSALRAVDRPPLRAHATATSDACPTWELEPLVLDGARALHGRHAPVSLEIPPGAIAVVSGPTGIGKTSLLRAMLGLEPLASGRIAYGARSLATAGVGPRQRPFAWVPQDAPVVGDTLAINVGLGRADDDGPVPDPAPLLAELGAEHLVTSLGDRVLGTERPLSGGERQWIAVARALATGLPVLLLDEPTSALDPSSQARLLDAIARLRGKRTVILVTHRPEPLAIADIVVRLGPEARRHGVSTSIVGPAVTSSSSAWKRSPSRT